MTAVLDRPTSADPYDGRHWSAWVAGCASRYFPLRFAPHHVDMWDWAHAIEPGQAPDEHLVAVLARGGGKSMNAEAIVAMWGTTGRRRYVLYVCDTQDRADDHVQNIAAILEGAEVERRYPGHASRAVGKFGNAKGWRRNRLRTADGFIVDALGLDTAARGIKVEDQRPDAMVVDDVDALHDTARATARKVGTLTKSVFPAGSRALAVLFVQNLILPDGIAAQLADGRAPFLAKRRVIGPVPALRNLQVSYDAAGRPLVDGDPTWEGQDVEECQRIVDAIGLPAFIEEGQHDVEDASGAKWAREQIDACRLEGHPELTMCAVVVDPSGGAGKGHDEQGIVAVGKGVDGKGYVLEDRSGSYSAAGWGARAVLLAIEVEADGIWVEDNYGGDSMTNTVTTAAEALVRDGNLAAQRYVHGTVHQLSAKGSKGERATPVAALYGDRDRPETWHATRVHHVGVFPELEREQRTWEPDSGMDSPNRLDALVHGLGPKCLGVVHAGRGKRRQIVAVG